MATINVYRVTEDRFAFVVGELKDGAACMGIQLKPEAAPDAAIAEITAKLDDLGDWLFIIQGGPLDLEKLHSLNASPELYTSFECDEVDASTFA